MLTGGWARVIVDGVDVCGRFGLTYTDESSRGPAAKRVNYIELPAMDGVLDASEMWTDDVVFGQRTETMVFAVDQDRDFEQVKTSLSNFLDGRRLDYSYSFDPGYTMTGRFRVTDYSGWRDQRITVEVDADPWKRGERRVYDVDCAGGVAVTVTNARRHVGPLFTVGGPTVVEYGGRAWEIPGAGTWRLDLRLDEGMSQIYVNTTPDRCDVTVDEFVAMLGDCALDEVPEGRRLFDFYSRGKPPEGGGARCRIEYDLYDL